MAQKIATLDLSGLPITFQATIPEEYRDEMGHMNVMWYTHLFSSAFEKFADEFGFNEEYFRTHNAGSFALETHVRYLSEVHVGWNITIRSRALGRSQKRIHFMHFMTIDESGKLAAIQEHVGAHIDMTARRMSPMPPDVLQRFDALVARQNQLGWHAPVCGVMRP